MTTIDNEIEFGVSEQQLWFLWRLERAHAASSSRRRSTTAAGCSSGSASEVEESSVHTYPAGPWHAGLEPFPDG